MTNNVYIDGEDARNRFGVWITKGGYDGLLAFPALKEPEENDWPEEDGVEADLSDPKLEAKELSISFLSDTNTAAIDLIVYLGLSGVHTFRIPSLGREWRLRLSDHPANTVYPLATSFSLRFVEDVPVRPVSDVLPDPGIRLQESRYRIDDIPVSAYGVVIDISRSALLKSPAAKLNMNRTVSTEDGQIYDADHLVFQKKETTFKCHFKAVSMDAFWGCYDTFFGNLIQPGERRLYVEEIGREFPCYYKNSTGFRILSFNCPVIVEFSLTLVFTVFRFYETDYFLATESGDWIVTEDGNFFIDMKGVNV